jgi:hypothetical protein
MHLFLVVFLVICGIAGLRHSRDVVEITIHPVKLSTPAVRVSRRIRMIRGGALGAPSRRRMQEPPLLVLNM